jgi:outer membrane protein assembly factor BamB
MLTHPVRARIGLVCLALGLSAAALAQAPAGKKDWPVFRGNAEQTGVASSALPARLTVLWKFSASDPIEGAVAVANGIVYAGSLDEHLYAIDLLTGKQKWKYKAGPLKAAPAVRGDAVYAGDLDGNLHCVDTKGAKRWTFEAGAEIGGINFWRDLVLFTSHDEHLYCLTKDGKQRWKFKVDGPVYGAPAVAEGKTFLVGCDSRLHVLDIATGKELRAVELGGQTGASGAVWGEQLYVGTMRNEVKAIDWKKGSVTWSFRARQAFFSSAAVTERDVVVGCRDNRVYALARKGGKQRWSFPTGGQVDSSPVIVGGRVVVGSLDGNLYVLDLANGRQVQRVALDGPGTGPVRASPVVVDGRVLIGTQKGTLYCLGAKE